MPSPSSVPIRYGESDAAEGPSRDHPVLLGDLPASERKLEVVHVAQRVAFGVESEPAEIVDRTPQRLAVDDVPPMEEPIGAADQRARGAVRDVAKVRSRVKQPGSSPVHDVGV